MNETKKMVTILTLFGIKDILDHATVLRKLREGLEINTVDSGGRTLLMEAVIRSDHELIDLLLESGADVNIRDKRDWTAPHFAVQEYDLVSTKQLISHGADVNARDDYGNNIISRAVMNSLGRGDVIQLLLAHGADAHFKNKSGISAFDSARAISNYNVIQYFE